MFTYLMHIAIEKEKKRHRFYINVTSTENQNHLHDMVYCTLEYNSLIMENDNMGLEERNDEDYDSGD